MTDPLQVQPPGWYPPPASAPPKLKTPRIVLSAGGAGLVVGAALGTVVTVALRPHAPIRPAAASHATTAPATSAPAPPPVANAKGTYQGACNYTLGSNPVGGTARATGDVLLHNTGNIGTVDKVRITWPQQGYAPLAMGRTVKLAVGASKDVQFHRAPSGTQVDNLQNWQIGHSGQSGCTYRATIVRTFGSAQ